MSLNSVKGKDLKHWVDYDFFFSFFFLASTSSSSGIIVDHSN